jgi:Uma2 family endonuclease
MRSFTGSVLKIRIFGSNETAILKLLLGHPLAHYLDCTVLKSFSSLPAGAAKMAEVLCLFPDRSVLSPDASWMPVEKWNRLTKEDQDRFAPVCPDFVIEVRSKTDDLEALKEKMVIWLKNGAQLGWLIDPRDKAAYIFRQGEPAKMHDDFTLLKGNEPVKGFELDLTALRV